MQDSAFGELGYLEELARQDTPIHRLDPRAKLITTLAFVVMVVSFDRYAVADLLPFLIYPVALAALANVPSYYLVRKMLLVSPFAVLVGIFNPFLDTAPVTLFGSVPVNAGWISFASILLRFVLTVSAALILIGCTPINRLALALERLGVPNVFAVQLLFLYRYLFVLTQEGARMVRAILTRSFNRKRMPMRTYGQFLGSLLLRTLDRAQRIHAAMRCRGFTGRVETLNALRLRPSDFAFVAGWTMCFVAFRFGNIVHGIGAVATGSAP